MISTGKLKSIISKKSGGNNVIAAQLYQMFFFEQILKRISKSKYKNNIILKGGLLLSSILGENMRTTRDMDATLKSIDLDKNGILNIFNEIFNIDLADNINFEIVSISDIRLENEYGGFRINVLGKYENMKIYMFVEITTGDKITPKEIDYNYNSNFTDDIISIFAYTNETIIAEKFETIITRSIANTRLKDFYDIFMIIDSLEIYINKKYMVTAIKNTFLLRGTSTNLLNIIVTIDLINSSEKLRSAWIKYQEKFDFSKGILYDDIIDKLYIIVDILKENNFN